MVESLPDFTDDQMRATIQARLNAFDRILEILGDDCDHLPSDALGDLAAIANKYLVICSYFVKHFVLKKFNARSCLKKQPSLAHIY